MTPKGWTLPSVYVQTNVSVRRVLFEALESILHIRDIYYFSIHWTFNKTIKNKNKGRCSKGGPRDFFSQVDLTLKQTLKHPNHSSISSLYKVMGCYALCNIYCGANNKHQKLCKSFVCYTTHCSSKSKQVIKTCHECSSMETQYQLQFS